MSDFLAAARAAELTLDAAAGAEFLKAARSASTMRAYASDWKQFATWIDGHGLEPLPADPRMVALWLSHMARRLRRRPSSIKRMLTTINVMHRRAGHPPPSDSELVREELRGIQNSLGVRQKRAAPVLITHLQAMVSAESTSTLRGIRDKALVLCGWSGALRRSEIVALNVADLSFQDRGARLLITRSKTDQQGEGAYVALFYATRTELCPVQALQAWLAATGIQDGAVFRNLTRSRSRPELLESRIKPDLVRYVVQRWAKRAGLQPEELGSTFSAHSLRAGFITEAARAKKPEWAIARQSRHKSATTLRGYIRVADVFTDAAGEDLL